MTQANDLAGSPESYEANVGHGGRTHVFDAVIVGHAGAEIFEELLTASEQDGHNREVHLIDERRTKVLPDGGRTTSDKNIKIARRFSGGAERGFNPGFDKEEGRASLHF